MKRLLILFVVVGGSEWASAADSVCVVPGAGHFRIHVDSGGLFSVFAHDHLIEAQMISGCANIDNSNLTNSSITLEFTSEALRVLDPKESAGDRAKVQMTMQTDVLRTSEFPRITFKSTRVESSTSPNQLRVHGDLTIRGTTRPAVIPLTLTRAADNSYTATGEYKFKQSLFGIKPIQLAGGTVKVKDEVRTEFELVLRTSGVRIP